MRTNIVLRFLLLCLLAVALVFPAGASSRGLTTGFYDNAFSQASGGGASRLDEARGSGAGIVRIQVSWGGIAPTRPAHGADPADPAYTWDGLDAAVASAKTRGLQVLLSFTGAPSWAQEGTPPRRDVAQSYRPNARAVGGFATALARRYASSAGYVQIFNEPNLNTYLSPQWESRHGKQYPFAATRYRAMLNAAYPGVHAAGMKLVTAGAAPYGDPGKHGQRTRPVLFWRTVLAKKVRFDVFSHHPYSVGGPRRHALSKLDVSIPDVHRLVTLVRSAVRKGRALPHRSKKFWVTEISWDSKPPDPEGVPARRHAHWLADSFFVLWKQGISHILWFQVRDQPPGGDYAATNQSGILLEDGTPKPAQRAFAFPFSCERRGSGTRVWFKAPAAGRVNVADAGGRVVKRVSPGSDRVATAIVAGRRTLHAAIGSQKSISCRA